MKYNLENNTLINEMNISDYINGRINLRQYMKIPVHKAGIQFSLAVLKYLISK